MATANSPRCPAVRWFGVNNSYITKLGFADSFITEPGTDFALPVKSDVFTYLMGKAKAWGMVLYEQVGPFISFADLPPPCLSWRRALRPPRPAPLLPQDWLITVYQSMKITRSSVLAGSAWLQAMADAASGLGMTIQYCA